MSTRPSVRLPSISSFPPLPQPKTPHSVHLSFPVILWHIPHPSHHSQCPSTRPSFRLVPPSVPPPASPSAI
jgi:hypothetical protein